MVWLTSIPQWASQTKLAQIKTGVCGLQRLILLGLQNRNGSQALSIQAAFRQLTFYLDQSLLVAERQTWI